MAGRAKRRTDGTARTRTLEWDARVDKRFHKANVLSGVPCWRIGSLVRLAAHALLRQRRGCLAVAHTWCFVRGRTSGRSGQLKNLARRVMAALRRSRRTFKRTNHET